MTIGNVELQMHRVHVITSANRARYAFGALTGLIALDPKTVANRSTSPSMRASATTDRPGAAPATDKTLQLIG